VSGSAQVPAAVSHVFIDATLSEPVHQFWWSRELELEVEGLVIPRLTPYRVGDENQSMNA
jgi:hypothetical protein